MHLSDKQHLNRLKQKWLRNIFSRQVHCDKAIVNTISSNDFRFRVTWQWCYMENVFVYHLRFIQWFSYREQKAIQAANPLNWTLHIHIYIYGERKSLSSSHRMGILHYLWVMIYILFIWYFVIRNKYCTNSVISNQKSP